MEQQPQSAVVLLSGGLDSATTAAIAKDMGFDLYALTVDYNQRHKIELEAAKRVGESLGVIEHKFVKLDLSAFGGSSLTADIEVPKDRDQNEEGIPITYVPARNTIMLSLALALAETSGSHDIFIGANAVDYSGYPDCRPEFISEFERLANLATKAGVEGRHFGIHAPLMELTKAEIIQMGTSLGVDYGLTHSCYDPTPEGLCCGHCDSCILRLKGFADAGLKDPVSYAK